MSRHGKPQYEQRGYLLPDTLDPDKYLCVCVPVPSERGHIRAFLGQLDELGHWWNWERDGAHSGTIAAHVWRNIVDFVRDNIDCAEEVKGVSGCCCGEQTNVQQRFNTDTGVLEVSYDGGMTWETAPPEQDPRNAVLVYPDTLPEGTDPVKKCAAANSITKLIMNQYQEQYDELNADAQRADLVAIILGLLMLIGILATGGLLNILGLALAVLVANYDAATFAGFFTETFWHDITCAFYRNVANDGSFSQTSFHQVITDITMDYPINDMPGKWIYNLLQMMGAAGLSNASQLGLDAGLSCDCDNCLFSDWFVSVGTLVSQSDTEIVGDAADGLDGHFYLTFNSPSWSTCCCNIELEHVSGAITTVRGYCPCTLDYSNPANFGYAYTGQAANLMTFRADGAFRLRIYSSGECP